MKETINMEKKGEEYIVYENTERQRTRYIGWGRLDLTFCPTSCCSPNTSPHLPSGENTGAIVLLYEMLMKEKDRSFR